MCAKKQKIAQKKRKRKTEIVIKTKKIKEEQSKQSKWKQSKEKKIKKTQKSIHQPGIGVLCRLLLDRHRKYKECLWCRRVHHMHTSRCRFLTSKNLAVGKMEVCSTCTLRFVMKKGKMEVCSTCTLRFVMFSPCTIRTVVFVGKSLTRSKCTVRLRLRTRQNGSVQHMHTSIRHVFTMDTSNSRAFVEICDFVEVCMWWTLQQS